MAHNNLKISVVTATWNCLGTIADCLASISSQSYPNREHVVIDGDSKDGTVEFLQSHNNKIAVLVSEKDRGIYDALSKGIKLATGDVVGFLHADDVYGDSEVLARIADAFADPTVCAVYGDLVYVSKDNPQRIVRYWKSSPFSSRRLSWGWMPPHPTLYVRREWYERLGGFDTNYRISADYFSVLSLFSTVGFKAIYLPHVLVKMRLGGISNRSFSNIVLKSREDLDALRRSRVGGFGTLIWKNLIKVNQFFR